MKNPKRFMAILFVGIAAVSTTVVWQVPREPVYQSRGLSSWLADFDAEMFETRLQAAVAVRQMGTNTVPFLVSYLQHWDPRANRELWWWQRWRNWLTDKLSIKTPSVYRRPQNVRQQTLAALDALGPDARGALPALEALLKEDPPDPQALYVIARIGQAGVPILEQYLTNSTSSEARLLRLEARCCLEMMASNSPTLYPPQSDPEGQVYMRRICEFNLKVLADSFREYQREHPEGVPPDPAESQPPGGKDF